MGMPESIRFIKLPEVLHLTGCSKSKHYNDIKAGLVPPPVQIGLRAMRYLEHEINMINRAKMAGTSVDDLKELVSSIVESRNMSAVQNYI